VQAFDTEDHSILMRKQYNFGLTGNARNLFSSYLSNCQQFVTAYTSKSDKEYVTVGYLGEMF